MAVGTSEAGKWTVDDETMDVVAEFAVFQVLSNVLDRQWLHGYVSFFLFALNKFE